MKGWVAWSLASAVLYGGMSIGIWAAATRAGWRLSALVVLAAEVVLLGAFALPGLGASIADHSPIDVRRGAAWALVAGAASAGGFVAFLKACDRSMLPNVQLVVSVGGVVIVSIVSRAMQAWTPTPRESLGMLLGLAAILLLTFEKP